MGVTLGVAAGLRPPPRLVLLQDFEAAASAFERVAETAHASPRQRQVAFANLAACLLALSRFGDAVAACNDTLVLLLGSSDGCAGGIEQSAAENMPANKAPISASKSSSSWAAAKAAAAVDDRSRAALAKLLARRGAAHAHCRRWAQEGGAGRRRSALYLYASKPVATCAHPHASLACTPTCQLACAACPNGGPLLLCDIGTMRLEKTSRRRRSCTRWLTTQGARSRCSGTWRSWACRPRTRWRCVPVVPAT